MKLVVDNLGFAFGGQRVFTGVSFAVAESELLGVIGPNGAGKSTLLACLHGALRPGAGSVAIDGVDLHTLSTRAIARRLAVVPQRCDVPFPVPVASFVMLGRYAHGSWLRGPTADDHDIVTAALDQLGLRELADRPIDQLSGGEFRRVLIAQALAQRPSMLLLDEPVQQLDLRHQIEVMEFARTFAHTPGQAGVVVLHELGLAARYCDRLLLLHEGHVAAIGDAAQVLSVANLEAAYGVRAEVTRSELTGAIEVTAIAPACKGGTS